MVIDYYKEAEKAYEHLTKVCSCLIDDLIEKANNSYDSSDENDYINDWAMMRVIHERMSKVHIELSIVEDLLDIKDKAKSTNNVDESLLNFINGRVHLYKFGLLTALDNNIMHSETHKYHDYRCIDFIHKWGDLCKYYKSVYTGDDSIPENIIKNILIGGN